MYHEQCYRSTGYFADLKEENDTPKFYPYENKFHPVFEKKTRGLKIIIPYLRSEFDNEDEIIKTVCDSFFISILDGQLEVHINDHVIKANTIENYVNDSLYYIQEVSDMKKVFTPLYVRTYKNEQPRDIVVSNIEKDFHFKIYFKYDENIAKGRVAIVRTIGMKIEDFAVKSNATKPFNAVLIGDLEEDGYLKSLENESHTKISAEDIKDPKLKRQATRFINNLSNAIAKMIDEEMKKSKPNRWAYWIPKIFSILWKQNSNKIYPMRMEPLRLIKANKWLKPQMSQPKRKIGKKAIKRDLSSQKAQALNGPERITQQGLQMNCKIPVRKFTVSVLI